MEAIYQQSIELMAKLPTIITTFARLRTGKKCPKPREDLGLLLIFLYMLNGVLNLLKLKLKL